MATFVWFLVCLCTVTARPRSIFDKAFEEVIEPRSPSSRIHGATPADTYSLVIQPLNFVPAVVAPNAFLYPDHVRLFGPSQFRGAVPIFKPLREFSFVHFVPMRPGFYVPGGEHLRAPYPEDPFPKEEEFHFASVAAPPPGFLPRRDAQVPRIPVARKPTPEADDGSFQQVVRIVNFPDAIGESPFEHRSDSSLAFSAPGGIVQSGQPHISFDVFRNSKASSNLASHSGNQPLDLIRVAGEDGPTIIEV